MMSYVVSFWKKAEADFLKLPKDIQQRISQKLKIAQEDPFNYFFRLTGRVDYKMRIGDYRVIADINMLNRAIEITKVGHRRNVYDES